jgi:hypothetical protein
VTQKKEFYNVETRTWPTPTSTPTSARSFTTST